MFVLDAGSLEVFVLASEVYGFVLVLVDGLSAGGSPDCLKEVGSRRACLSVLYFWYIRWLIFKVPSFEAAGSCGLNRSLK